MVAVSRSSTFHRYTIYYSEGPVLRRILTAAQYAGAEPVWHFIRLGGRAGFRIELMVGGLSHPSADAFAKRMEHMPGVTKVMWAQSARVAQEPPAEGRGTARTASAGKM